MLRDPSRRLRGLGPLWAAGALAAPRFLFMRPPPRRRAALADSLGMHLAVIDPSGKTQSRDFAPPPLLPTTDRSWGFLFVGGGLSRFFWLSGWMGLSWSGGCLAGLGYGSWFGGEQLRFALA
jgi:hypothetical protein